MPSEREVDERNVDRATLRAWCPHCVKGRGEAYEHPRCRNQEKEILTISVDYVCAHPEQEEDEEKDNGDADSSGEG